MNSLVYLDNAATTKPLPELDALWVEYGAKLWFNPSALYSEALEVRRAVEAAREDIAAAYGSPEHRCTFTSGGTEAANMVIRFGARKRKRMNYVCGGLEHPCVEESFKALHEAGADVRFAPVRPDGSTSVESILELTDENTALVSVMHVSNETGAINNIEAMALAVKSAAPYALFHSDGVQAFGRCRLMRPDLIDYYTVSAHKIHGLKGTGAVLSRMGTPLREMMRGGGQEKGLRSGTENVFGILAFSEAARRCSKNRDAAQKRFEQLRAAFLGEVTKDAGIIPAAQGADYIVSLFVDGVRGETLMHMLEKQSIIIATGSACSSGRERSRAASALGVSKEKAASMIRISFSEDNTTEQALRAGAAIRENAEMLRKATGR